MFLLCRFTEKTFVYREKVVYIIIDVGSANTGYLIECDSRCVHLQLTKLEMGQMCFETHQQNRDDEINMFAKC